MKYRKRPVVIEAVQWTGENCTEIDAFCGGAIIGAVVYKRTFKVGTLEGTHTASVGDYIIKGVKGEFYPCKPDIFDMTYEVSEDSVPVGEPAGKSTGPVAESSTLSLSQAHPRNPNAKCKCEHWQFCADCRPTMFGGANALVDQQAAPVSLYTQTDYKVMYFDLLVKMQEALK